MSGKTETIGDFSSLFKTQGIPGTLKRSIDAEKTPGSLPSGYRITLLSSEGSMLSQWVPLPAKGKYSFKDKNGEPAVTGLSLVEANGKWEARCSGNSAFIGPSGHRFHHLTLSDQCLVPLVEKESIKTLYSELTYTESGTFHNYRPLGPSEITIGKLPDNDIVYAGNLVSRRHAKLLYSDGVWTIKDTGSLNGVYINGVRVLEQPLALGDEIYIMGLRILIGCGFISINDANPKVRVHTDKLELLISTAPLTENTSYSASDNAGQGDAPVQVLFSPLPRRMTAMAKNDIELEAPPLSMDNNGVPLLLRVGDPLVKDVSSLLSGNVMMLPSLLFHFASQNYTEKQKKEYEERRKLKYTEYLRKKEKEIRLEKLSEEKALRINYPKMNYVLHYPREKTQLWERRNTDDDFLLLRIGQGKIPLKASILAPQHRFDLEEDSLEQEMYKLANTHVELENVPITVDLREDRVIGVNGEREASLRFVSQLIRRLAILYSYDELKIVLLAEEKELQDFEFMRNLPHAWDDQRSIRFLATDDSEAYQIGEYLKNSVEKDLANPRELNKILRERPYYLIVALSKRLVDGIEAVKQIIKQEKNIGVGVISVYGNIPKECSLLLRVKDDMNCSITYLRQPDKSDLPFRADSFDEELARESMRILANTSLKLISQSFSFPKTLSFLEMFGVGKVEHLNAADRWNNSNPIKSLAAPVGVAADGTLFQLDLHQKFQGPHGLVAGMTGSGKSEFLITYILSMAILYHPDEVSFVLIDYKGGGLAGAFNDPARGIRLPHLMGTITNLDGSSIQRSLVSIESELKRRQRVFNEAKSLSGEGTMDIYTYQRLVRNGVVEEPIPHLFIISDEFAELKTQQPEFMDQLISAARIGRSLGIHLILATQKPSGIVNDQIRSNTKFQVCLKVQDKLDSMDMIGRPDAAELKDTGRFYLQVGYNEYFALGQSGWSGAEYEPREEVIVNRDDSVQVIDTIGQTVLEVKPKKEKGITHGSQLVAVVKYLSSLASELGIAPRSLWKEPLSEKIDADELLQETAERQGHLMEEEGITAVLGMLDDPSGQDQFPLSVDITRSGHLLIVGDQGSGKSVLLQTLLLTLSEKYAPDKLNYYLLDYSGRMLSLFRTMPHCGAVLNEDHDDLLKPFFNLIDQIVTERRQLFANLEVDSYEAAARYADLPLILVVIDNIAGFMSSKKGYEYYSRLDTYLKSGASYGIRYIITMNHLNEMNGRIRQEIPARLALHMKDRYEYGDALDCRCTFTPAERSGRGLALYEGQPLEFQAAMYYPYTDGKERSEKLKERLRKRADELAGAKRARRLAVVSETETYAEFAVNFSEGRIPLGYSLRDAKSVALPLKQFKALSLYFGDPEGTIPVLENFLLAAKREEMDLVIVTRPLESVFDPHASETVDKSLTEGAVFLNADEEGLKEFSRLFSKEILTRNKVLTEYCAQNKIDPERADVRDKTFDYMRRNVRPLFILLEGYADLCRLAEDGDEKLLNKFAAYFTLASRYQIYMIACAYPGDDKKLSGCELIGYFNTEKMAMLFGGRLDKQPLVPLPAEYGKSSGKGPYNRCLMYYRKDCYALLMPCGELKAEKIDEEQLSIF